MDDAITSSSGDSVRGCGIKEDTNKSPGSMRTYSHRYHLSDYHIEELSEYDDVDIVKKWHRTLMLFHPFVIAWLFMTYSAYFGYRVWCNYQYRLIHGGLAEASWIFICAEGICLRMYCPHILLGTKLILWSSSIYVLDDCLTAISW